jgi:hypothetical protein
MKLKHETSEEQRGDNFLRRQQHKLYQLREERTTARKLGRPSYGQQKQMSSTAGFDVEEEQRRKR